jgi:hypothetical protein
MTIVSIIPIPGIFETKRILCVRPHYVDNDIAAAGILAQLAKCGAELFNLTATDDLMGVVDTSLSEVDAAQALKDDQFAAGKIIGIQEQFWCGYPDASEYSYFALRRDFLKYIQILKPIFILAPDPWLTYEGHRDHIQTGLAAAQRNIFQTIALVPGAALPPLLAEILGWSGMAPVFAVVSVFAIYLGFPFLFEREELKMDAGFPFSSSLGATFFNKSYLLVTGSQAIRFFGMSGFVITLNGLLVLSVFDLVMPAFGYNILLDVHPASVELGFHIFLTVPTSIGFLLAIFLLWLYPLHGDYLTSIQDILAKKSESQE